MGGVSAVAGILLIALPTAILGSAFVQELKAATGAPDAASGGGREETPRAAAGEEGTGGATDLPEGARCPCCGAPLAGTGEG